MTLNEIEKRLKVWQKRHDELMAAYDAFYDLTGASIGCKLFNPIFNLLDAYTASVSELVGDDGDWLSWFSNDCDMGNKPKIYVTRKNLDIRVSTLKQLARVIAD